MSCRRCSGPDSGTTDFCTSCEAAVEHEQALDDELEPGRPVAPGYLDLHFYDRWRDLQAEAVDIDDLRELEQAPAVMPGKQANRAAAPSPAVQATVALPEPARALAADHHEKGTAAA